MQAVKEAVIGSSAELTEAQSEDRQAAEIALDGDFTDPKADPVAVIRSALGNAFVQAIKPGNGDQDDKKKKGERKKKDGKRKS